MGQRQGYPVQGVSLGEGFPFRATYAAPGIWCASITNTRNSGQIARGVHGVGLV